MTKMTAQSLTTDLEGDRAGGETAPVPCLSDISEAARKLKNVAEPRLLTVMTKVFPVSGIYHDRWLACDAQLHVVSPQKSIHLVFFLPPSETQTAEKSVVVLDGQTLHHLMVRRGQELPLTLPPREAKDRRIRIFSAYAEKNLAADSRQLGVKLTNVSASDTEGPVYDETMPQAVSMLDLTPPEVPGYWDLRDVFDLDHYLSQIGEGEQLAHEPHLHYLLFGAHQKLEPVPGFDTAFYRQQLVDHHIETDENPFLHYLFKGRSMGLRRARDAAVERDRLSYGDAQWATRVNELLQAIGIDPSDLGTQNFSPFILKMFDPLGYREKNGLAQGMTEAELLIRYLMFDLPRGLPPGKLFDEAHYRKQLKHSGIHLTRGEMPFLHWLRDGVQMRLSPTPLFDEEEYLRLNPDLRSYPNWLFEHWIMHGVDENRMFDQNLRLARNRNFVSETESWQPGYIRGFLMYAAREEGWTEALMQMRQFRRETLEDIISEANAIDPNVGHVGLNVLSMVPPLHDEDYATASRILRKLPVEGCDAVVMMPFCKLGGADFVAGVLTQALTDLGRRTVVLRTEMPDWERPDWFPEDVVSIDISAELNALPQQMQSRALYETVRHLRCSAVFNVNSRRAFEMIDDFGAQLKLFTHLFCYYFCADRTPTGHEAGYPVWYFASILPHLSAALVDTDFLAGSLASRHALGKRYAEKLKVLYTPSMHTPRETPLVEAQIASADERERPLVLWAGRFDRQKRFDLLAAVAKAMPEVQFRAWGKAVLDQPPDVSSLPENLTLEGPFASYDELPLEACDGWLYTSAWDGMPTILIELAAMGMPIVASAVGGVPEMIDTDTGWPIAWPAPKPGADTTPTASEVAEYVTAIREMLDHPEKRRERVTALQARVWARHVQERFGADLQSLLGDKTDD